MSLVSCRDCMWQKWYMRIGIIRLWAGMVEDINNKNVLTSSLKISLKLTAGWQKQIRWQSKPLIHTQILSVLSRIQKYSCDPAAVTLINCWIQTYWIHCSKLINWFLFSFFLFYKTTKHRSEVKIQARSRAGQYVVLAWRTSAGFCQYCWKALNPYCLFCNNISILQFSLTFTAGPHPPKKCITGNRSWPLFFFVSNTSMLHNDKTAYC